MPVLFANHKDRFFPAAAQMIYGKCSKISNTFLILFSNKMFVIKARFSKMLVRIANSTDPDQTEAV